MATVAEHVMTEKFIPLTPAIFHIMLALAQGECHGYGIMQEVNSITEGNMRLGPGTLYRSLQRMKRDGFIAETELSKDHESEDERRINYRLTDFGRDVVRAEAKRLERLVQEAKARKIL